MVTLSFVALSEKRSCGKRGLLRLVLWLSRLKGATLKWWSSLSPEENSVCYNSLIGKVTTPSVLTLSGLANFFSDYFRTVLFALSSHRNSAMKRTVLKRRTVCAACENATATSCNGWERDTDEVTEQRLNAPKSVWRWTATLGRRPHRWNTGCPHKPSDLSSLKDSGPWDGNY